MTALLVALVAVVAATGLAVAVYLAPAAGIAYRHLLGHLAARELAACRRRHPCTGRTPTRRSRSTSPARGG